jgi:hypothetical protein
VGYYTTFAPTGCGCEPQFRRGKLLSGLSFGAF